MGFADLKARYSTSEPVTTRDLPPSTAAVTCRTSFGLERAARLRDDGSAAFDRLPVGTHAIESWSPSHELLFEEFTTVSERPGDDPVIGFATSFDSDSVEGVLAWLRKLRCTVVQFYDWMECYSAPLPQNDDYADPLGRPLVRGALERLVSGVRSTGAVAQAYAPVGASDAKFATAHRDWLLYDNDDTPQHLGDLLQIMDPANAEWQRHWITAYGDAAHAIGFDGFHLDTYGYPRRPFDANGAERAMGTAYSEFVASVRRAFPQAVLSFNQVNGVPSPFALPALPAFRYLEVWPPNDQWRHLEALITRGARGDGRSGGVLAVYPPVWKKNRAGALRTVVLTEAVATALGSGLILFGDRVGALRNPYYPDHARLDEDEATTVLDWHRFALRCRDLFRGGEDTSWTEIGDENASVRIDTRGLDISPEPAAGTLFARVVRRDAMTAISLIDLSGSASGSWTRRTKRSKRRDAKVRLLVANPERCRAEVAVLGRSGGRFRRVALAQTSHREGRAVEAVIPIAEGWSVLRLDESSSA